VRKPALSSGFGRWKRLFLLVIVLGCPAAFAQGGPPYYTNDPGTPGNHNWEINLGYMPFLYTDQSITHTPDVDINFGLGDRIQLTFENAWLRVQAPSGTPKYGLGQDQLGVKWRFYDNEESGFAISVFPQLSVNNPNSSVARGITPRSASLILPPGVFQQARTHRFELGSRLQLCSYRCEWMAGRRRGGARADGKSRIGCRILRPRNLPSVQRTTNARRRRALQDTSSVHFAADGWT
jgi:hypothetical protein